MSRVTTVKFTDYRSSIARALDLAEAADLLPRHGLIIIKPNLTNSSPPPVTTSVEAAEAVYDYCKARTKADIAIGDGCGNGVTADVFAALGYTALAEKRGIRLIDFNDAETTLLEDTNALQLKQFHIPSVVRDAFVISLPVLKDHSFSGTTIAMKNMFGIAPGKFYANGWNKAKLHRPSTDESIVDICRYKSPDLSVVDASVALSGMHLSGIPNRLGLILASFDPVAVDTVGSRLMGHDPRRLPYLALSDGLHGRIDNVEIVTG